MSKPYITTYSEARPRTLALVQEYPGGFYLPHNESLLLPKALLFLGAKGHCTVEDICIGTHRLNSTKLPSQLFEVGLTLEEVNKLLSEGRVLNHWGQIDCDKRDISPGVKFFVVLKGPSFPEHVLLHCVEYVPQ